MKMETDDDDDRIKELESLRRLVDIGFGLVGAICFLIGFAGGLFAGLNIPR